MRHTTLVTLALWAVCQIGYAQDLYKVVPRELNEGYEIAEGGTILVEDGLIAAWDISITGDRPYTFSDSNPGADVFGEFKISDTQITFEMNRVGSSRAGFYSSEVITPCRGETCDIFLSWTSVGPPNDYVESSLLYSIYTRAPSGVPMGSDLAGLSELPVGEYLVATAVPEPSGFMILIVGLGVVAIRQGRPGKWKSPLTQPLVRMKRG